MVHTIVMMVLSTSVMARVFLEWLDHPEVVGMTPEGPASSSSWCEGCKDCEALGGSDEGGEG